MSVLFVWLRRDAFAEADTADVMLENDCPKLCARTTPLVEQDERRYILTFNLLYDKWCTEFRAQNLDVL